MSRFRIHVSGTVLGRNAVTGACDPPVLVKDRHAEPGRQFSMVQDIEFSGAHGVLKHRAGRVWLELDGDVRLIGARAGLDSDQPEPPE